MHVLSAPRQCTSTQYLQVYSNLISCPQACNPPSDIPVSEVYVHQQGVSTRRQRPLGQRQLGNNYLPTHICRAYLAPRMHHVPTVAHPSPRHRAGNARPPFASHASRSRVDPPSGSPTRWPRDARCARVAALKHGPWWSRSTAVTLHRSVRRRGDRLRWQTWSCQPWPPD